MARPKGPGRPDGGRSRSRGCSLAWSSSPLAPGTRSPPAWASYPVWLASASSGRDRSGGCRLRGRIAPSLGLPGTSDGATVSQGRPRIGRGRLAGRRLAGWITQGDELRDAKRGRPLVKPGASPVAPTGPEPVIACVNAAGVRRENGVSRSFVRRRDRIRTQLPAGSPEDSRGSRHKFRILWAVAAPTSSRQRDHRRLGRRFSGQITPGRARLRGCCRSPAALGIRGGGKPVLQLGVAEPVAQRLALDPTHGG
jgi:hypothetical protein